MLTRRTLLSTGIVGTIAASALALPPDKNTQTQTYGPPTPTGPTDNPGAFAPYEPPSWRAVEASAPRT
jgi:hypothetical protein